MSDHLTWGLPVILYLFLAGLGAGTVAVSASVLLRGGGGGFAGRHHTIAQYGALIGPIPVMLGTFLIIFELGRPFRFMNLLKVVNLSPMNIGSWLLMLFITVSIVYALVFLPWPEAIRNRVEFLKRPLAWACVPLGIGVAVYTGIMLGAMPSRPFWNSPILALIFLISSLSTGVATLILAQTLMERVPADDANAKKQFHQSAYLLTASDVLLIALELMAIFLFVLFAHLTVGDVKYAASVILPGGDLASLFWVWVVLVGLLIPGIIEMAFVVPRLLYHREYKAPRFIEIVVPVAILVGGFMLRYVVVVAGQVTGPVGL